MLQAGIERAPLPPLRTELSSPAPGLTAPSDRVQVQTAEAPEQRDRRRDPYLDNAKYLTIVLVAVGHSWAPLTGDSRTTSALYYLLYSFHMPAFIVISGYLSRGFECRPRQIKRLIAGLVVPYVVFQTLFTFFMRWAADDPDREFRYQEPGFAMWFLVALCLWRLTTPIWKILRWPLPVSVAIAVAASVTPSVNADLDLMRAAQFLPFFVLGLRLRPEHLEMVRRRAVRILAVPVTAGALLVSYWAVPRISGAPFLHDRAAQELGLPAWAGAVMTLASFGCALVMTVCFLSWVPRRRMWFTTLGAGTLYAYVLHIYPLQLSQRFDWYGTYGADLPLGRIGVTVLAAAMMTVLCAAPVRKTFRLLVEPRMRWFFSREANAPDGAPTGTSSGASAGMPELPPAAPAPAPELPPAEPRRELLPAPSLSGSVSGPGSASGSGSGRTGTGP